MNCDRCGAAIKPGDERRYAGSMLCEECYMDALSPVKACDPWAVYSAKSFEQHQQKESELTPLQNEILRILEEAGPLELWELKERLDSDMDEKELQRQFAVLRHLEKVRGEKHVNKVFLRLWD
ncbi:MAG: hypothetical protein R6U13_00540 [Desulfatiglandaceae bacterium]